MNNSDPIVRLRTNLSIEGYKATVQQLIADHYDELKEVALAELNAQMTGINLAGIVQETLKGAVEREIRSLLNDVFGDMWWSKEFSTHRKSFRTKIGKALAESITRELPEEHEED